MPPNDARLPRMAGRAAALLLTGALAAPATAAETEESDVAPSADEVLSDEAPLDGASEMTESERRNQMEQRHKLQQQRPMDRQAGEEVGEEEGEASDDEAEEAEADTIEAPATQRSRRGAQEEARKQAAPRDRRP